MNIRRVVFVTIVLMATVRESMYGEIGGALKPLEIVVAKSTETPQIDGEAGDKAWAAGKSYVIRMKKIGKDSGRVSDLVVTAIHNGSLVHLLFQWFDATRDDSHKSWVWNKEKNAYEQGGDIEDVFSIGFPIKGPFTGVMTSPVECVWDVWHWKAARTNPAGYAMDKSHVYTFKKPEGKAKSFKTRSRKLIWIARPEDEGDSPQAKQKAPETFKGEKVAQYIPGKPSGSASDLVAKGAWRNGLWTLELSRKLDTGHPDDAAFAVGKSIKAALGVFDHSEHEDHSVSKVLLLKLAE